MAYENSEIEVRFLEIDAQALKKKLNDLGAEDFGEDFLEEIIFYKNQEWWDYKRKFIRLRKTKEGSFLTFKHQEFDAADGTEEIEVGVSDFDKTVKIFERLGLGDFMRRQQKRRHKFKLDGVVVDIDDWPKVPTYVELEGDSEQSLKAAAAKLGLNWQDAVFEPPRVLMEKRYNIPLAKLKWFTFDRIE